MTYWANVEFLEVSFSKVLGLEFCCLAEVAVHGVLWAGLENCACLKEAAVPFLFSH